jgi:hypothetical protein
MNNEGSSSTRVDMHGVVIDAALPPWESVFRTLLGFFTTTDAAATLTIEVARATTQPSPPFERGWTKRFFFGVVQGYVGDVGYGLEDARSRCVVDVQTHRIFAEILVGEGDATAVTTSGMLHAALCLYLRERGLFELHAAGLHADDGARLVIGNAGSGKTSTAIALLHAGCQYLGDDRVLIRRSPDERDAVELRAYPRAFHLALATGAAYPALLAQTEALDGIGGKRALAPDRAFPGAFRAGSSGPVALLLPRVARVARTEVSRVSPADALGALLESSALALVDGVRHRDDNLSLLATLANKSPAFRVELGRDALEHPVDVARRILDATRP